MKAIEHLIDFKSHDDRPEEACGLFGVFARGEDVARLTYFGLHGLQHRGQESSGIAVADGRSTLVFKDLGLVPQVFDERTLASLQGHLAIGHVRYSTTGKARWENAQPVHKSYNGGTLALAHNGNIINARDLRNDLRRLGSRLDSTSDTEVIAELIASHADMGIEEAIKTTMRQLKGAYSVVLVTEDKLYAMRDPRGIRPLCIGKLKESYVFASETCGLDIVGADYIRDVQPGEIITVDESGLSASLEAPSKESLCIFEFIYFARPDSRLYGKLLYKARKAMGATLASEAHIDGHLVVGIPDSGTPAAVGYAEASGIPFGEGLIKNRYVGRTFIQPTQTMRQLGIRLKLNPLREIIAGKSLVVVDDSIVRGNTSRKIVKMLKQAGAKEVHLRISSPPVRWPCFYGIDTANRSELIGSTMSQTEIREYIGADSLEYLSFDGLIKAVSRKREDFCTACFDGNYPIEIPEELRINKIMLGGKAVTPK